MTMMSIIVYMLFKSTNLFGQTTILRRSSVVNKPVQTTSNTSKILSKRGGNLMSAPTAPATETVINMAQLTWKTVHN